MRWNTILMLGLALVFGAGSIFAGQQWLARQASLQRAQFAAGGAPPASVPMGTLVVAAEALRYGTELGPRQLREIRWPEEAIPAGAFRSAAELLADKRRIVLTAIEANEPILKSKVTGPGQRGTLSTLLEDGMGAVTVQVNEVVGVAGFVLPGDRIDLLATRQVRTAPSDGSPPQQSAFTDVVLQNVRVLAVGQVADERADKPAVVNAVTLEVDAVGAQRIAVAASVGSLSLMLRKAGEVAAKPGRRVSLAEIGEAPMPAMKDDRSTLVRVTRATKREEYSVPAGDTQAAARPAPTRLVRAQ